VSDVDRLDIGGRVCEQYNVQLRSIDGAERTIKSANASFARNFYTTVTIRYAVQDVKTTMLAEIQSSISGSRSGMQLSIDGTPNVAIVVAKRTRDVEAVWSAKLKMTRGIRGVLRPNRDTIAIWIPTNSHVAKQQKNTRE